MIVATNITPHIFK